MATMQNQKSAGVWFIFFTILLDAIGLGILIPVLPDVLRRFTSDPSAVSEYFGYFVGVYALMQFIASPVLGSLSDKYGRKFILLISLLGAGLDYLFMAFAPTMGLLFLGRVISGLTGASMTVASSYMADISDDNNRAAHFGMIGAAWGSGFICGPLLGGLFSHYGATAPFLIAALLNVVNFIFGLFILPESLPPEKRRHIDWSHLNPLASVFKILQPSPYVMLVWIYFLILTAGQIHPVNWTLYTQTKFGWSAWEVGLSLSFVGLTIALSQAFLTRLLIPRLGEERSITVGIAIYSISFVLFGLAAQGWMMYAVMIVFCVAGITMPALQSILAKYVPSNQQGQLQGSLMSLASLSSTIAPLIFTPLFIHFTQDKSTIYFPGAAYVGAGLICLIALGLRFIKKPVAI